MKSTSAYHLIGVSLLALAAPMPAFAQNAAPAVASEPESGLTDIIVTARRRDESIQDVPSVVNAVTANEIDKLNLRNFSDVQSLVPGLELSSNANGIGGNAKLRGVNFDINASGNNPTVEFYLNDAPITAGVILQQMYDVGQIEVLRGPQGTLRGRASPSGSITVTTRKPDLDRFGGYAEATGNDIGTINAQGAINIPILPGIAAIRIAGLRDENEGNRVRPVNGALGGRDPYSRTYSGRITGLVEPIDWLRLEGSFQRIDRDYRSYDQSESFSQVNPAAAASPVLITAKDRLSINPLPRIVSQRFDIYNGRAEVALVGQRLIYQFQHYTQAFDSAETQDKANFFPGIDVNQNTRSRIRSTSHEVRLQNEERVFGMFDYVVGLFDNKNNTPTTLNVPTPVRLPVAFGGGIATIAQTAVARLGHSHEQSAFGNLTLHIGDSTEISGGGRYIHYQDQGQLLVGGNLLSNDGQKENKVIYSASVKHYFTPDFMVYASTGSSFRPGIFTIGDFNITPSALENSFLDLPPETSKSYEVGVKTSFFDKKLRFNLSGYHQTFNNFPYRSPTGVFYVNTVAVRNAAGAVTGLSQQVGTFNFVGAVPVTVNGLEGDLAYSFSDRFNIGVTASYSLGKIKKGTVPCNDLNGDGKPDVTTAAPTVAQLQAATGANNISACQVTQRSAFQSPFSATVQSEYTLPVSDKVDAFLRGLFTFNGASQSDPTNSFDNIGKFGLLNLYTGVRDPDGMWELTLFAKNVFNTTKVLSRTDPLSTSYQQLGFAGQFANGRPVFTGPTGATFSSAYNTITTTAPQEFGVSLKFRFGSR